MKHELFPTITLKQTESHREIRKKSMKIITHMSYISSAQAEFLDNNNQLIIHIPKERLTKGTKDNYIWKITINSLCAENVF